MARDLAAEIFSSFFKHDDDDDDERPAGLAAAMQSE